jgi:hypothetical protein
VSGDPLIAELRRRDPGCGFCAATDAVIAGHDLRNDGNRQVGRDIYIQTWDPPTVPRAGLSRGLGLRVGARETFPHCELRCVRDGERIAVLLVAADGREPSRRLWCAAGSGDEYDEACFLWLAPQEFLCTPWHDGDPQCQVVTVEGLRAFAAAWAPTMP